MIANLMAYGIIVAVLLGAAGLAFERVAGARRLPRRAVWAAALTLSVTLSLLSTVVPHFSRARADQAIPVLSPTIARNSEATVIPSGPAAPMKPLRISHVIENFPTTVLASAQIENALRWLWLFASAGLVALYATLSLQLWAAARRWQRNTIEGHEVWVTGNMGPAVVGFLRPRILMPRWVLEAPQGIRAFVLTHEQEHIRAGDQWLVLLGLLVIAAAPWNLPLWWQLRRMRFAIEVDCDARVLSLRADPRAYGEALLSIGQRQSFTPVMAIALTEPASQLLRRIRIMTSSLPKRGTRFIGTVLGAALTCAAVAAQLQAPALQSPTTAPSISVAIPLKPPYDGRNPWNDSALAAARSLYPELLHGPAPKGHFYVTLALNADGSVFKATKAIVGPTDWNFGATDQTAFDRVGVYAEQLQVSGVIFEDVSTGSAIPYTVTYAVLKPEPELTRLRLLRKAVMEPFAQSFRVLTENGPRVNMLTVFLTDSGGIDKSRVDLAPDATHPEPFPLLTTEPFAALGVDPNRVGLIGKMMLLASPDRKGELERGLFVVYGWPRHAGEPGPTVVPDDDSRSPGDDPAVDLAIVERYLPDAFTTPESSSTPLPWVLLDRAGNVLRAGRFRFTSSYVLSSYLEALYPGTKIQDYFGGPVTNAKGARASVSFLWLAPNSQITNLSKVDPARRKDVFLTLSMSGGDNSYPIELPMVLKFGKPTTADGGGVVQLQAVATDASAVHVDIEMQLHPSGASGAPTMGAKSNDAGNGARTDQTGSARGVFPWAPDAPKVRIGYGADATMTFQDDKQRTWKIVMRPYRITPQ